MNKNWYIYIYIYIYIYTCILIWHLWNNLNPQWCREAVGLYTWLVVEVPVRDGSIQALFCVYRNIHYTTMCKHANLCPAYIMWYICRTYNIYVYVVSIYIYIYHVPRILFVYMYIYIMLHIIDCRLVPQRRTHPWISPLLTWKIPSH